MENFPAEKNIFLAFCREKNLFSLDKIVIVPQSWITRVSPLDEIDVKSIRNKTFLININSNVIFQDNILKKFQDK